MTNSPARHRAEPRGRPRATLAAVTGFLIVGALGAGGVAMASTKAAESSTATSSATSPTPSPSPAATPAVGGAGRFQNPVTAAPPAARSGLAVSRVQIPAIGVDAAVELIDRDADGVLLPPAAWADAGWYRSGVLPGQVGPAVIAGHLDTTLREAVFAHLKQLGVGDRVTVTLSDGSQSTFSVDSAINVEKKAFPTQQVYGPTPDAQLRLITCNGPFDDAAHSYANEYVVFASLVPSGG